MSTPMPVMIVGWAAEVAAKLDLVWQLSTVAMLATFCMVFLLAWIAIAVSFRR